MAITRDTEWFIKKARDKFGDKFDYSETIYNGARQFLTIICPIHGKYEQRPNDHLGSKHGCPKCALEYNKGLKKNIVTTEDFIKRAKAVHGDAYDYSKSVYTGTNNKLTITCPEHGDFEQTPGHHYSGQGCPVCRYIKTARSATRDFDEVLKLANEKHHGKYDYSLITDYKGCHLDYEIICPEHGVFRQSFINHAYAGEGCPKCGRIQFADSRRNTTEQFVEMSKNVHGDLYDYSNTVYKSVKTKLAIICPIHGEFWQTPANHIWNKQGCPQCFKVESKVESEMYQEIVNIVGENWTIKNDREKLDKKEIDVWVPSKNVGFEMNGVYWHSTKFEGKTTSIEKFHMAESKNITLIQIFEDEWIEKREICVSIIERLLSKNIEKINPSNCEISQIYKFETEKFLKENDIFGVCDFDFGYKLHSEDNIYQIILLKQSGGKCVAVRLTTKNHCIVIDKGQSLIEHVLKNNEIDSLEIYQDLRFGNGRNFVFMGFKQCEDSEPNFKYFQHRQKRLSFEEIVKEYKDLPLESNEKFDEKLSELCVYKIYDCGVRKFVLNKS